MWDQVVVLVLKLKKVESVLSVEVDLFSISYSAFICQTIIFSGFLQRKGQIQSDRVWSATHLVYKVNVPVFAETAFTNAAYVGSIVNLPLNVKRAKSQIYRMIGLVLLQGIYF